MYPIHKYTCEAPIEPFSIGQHRTKRLTKAFKKLFTNPNPSTINLRGNATVFLLTVDDNNTSKLHNDSS
jgi:hypothetical protein